MNEFVEQCRREWKRLGVRAAVADEMAAELAADLEEGASPEEVLGSDAADASSFAAAWARERGVIPDRTRNPRVIVPVVATTLVLAAAAGVALMLAASSGKSSESLPHGPPRDVVVGPPPEPPKFEPARIYEGPPFHVRYVTTPAVRVRNIQVKHKHALPGARCYDAVDLVATPCVWPNGDMASTLGIAIESSGVDWPKVGLGLTLFAGIGLILLASAWLWSRVRRSSHAVMP